ncbi:MAG TPA: GNAT family N-acetyltransferase [Verrucomicrobiae bacterium]|nr:GNAT family N-acetyltransferase [Verrucomicrobiae bacterium]
MVESIRIECIDSSSPHLKAVIELGNQHAETLGFFPKGAFQEHASRKHIFVALTSRNECLGYLLYRISSNRAVIVHLCANPTVRKKGVARKLVEHLKAETKHLFGIGLHCRRDYEVNSMWPRLGFAAVHSKPGRGNKPSQLTYWWLNHGHADLFSSIEQADENKQRIVIDANVFFELHDPNDIESEESKSLLAPWLQDILELCLTKEIYNEIDRAKDMAKIQSYRKLAQTYHEIAADDTRVQNLIPELQKLIQWENSPSGESDLRQIANSIAGGIQVFVTRERVLRSHGDRLYEKFGLTVLHPTELINQLDSVKREAEYQPARLAGSRMKEMLLTSEHEALAIEAFQQTALGERKSDFQKHLHRHLSHPKESECKLIVDENEHPVVLIIRNRSTAHTTEIPLLRTARHPLAPTVVRHLLRQTLEDSARENRDCTKVSDGNAGAVVVDALRETGFVPVGATWMKINLACVETATAITVRLFELAKNAPELKNGIALIATALADLQKNPLPTLAAQIERALWPAKIVDADLPSFIVPIRPEWAEHFFDEELASRRLFGLRHDLHFGREAVYYRSKQISGLKFPGRILWYVSQGNENTGSMSVKACSSLDEIVIGKPKELYKQFRRLGVYEWRNVWELAHKNLDEKIMAIRFGDTERFHTPVSHQQLKKLGIAGTIQSPRPITQEVFAKIYSMGYPVTRH